MTTKTLRTIVLACLGVIAAVAGASAETLMMPKRDALRGVPLVIWGVTTLPNHTAASPTVFTINFSDGTPNVSGNVTDRSYINNVHTFPNAGTFTVTLVVQNGASIETATVDVRVVDPAALGGVGTVTGNVGPGSNEVYRDVRINMAIQDGLRFLWQAQRNRTTNFPAGTMVDWSNQRQWTAFAVTAFENHGYRLPSNPAVLPTGIYEKYIVQKGLNFIVNGLSTLAIANQPTSVAPGQPVNRNPCVGVNIEPTPCTGLTDASNNPGYTIGIAMMPLAASSALNRVNGTFGPALIQAKPYSEILQRLSNTLVWGQIDANVAGRGGWGYTMNTTTQDGSVMGWAILGLLDAEAAGTTVPSWVKTEVAWGVGGAPVTPAPAGGWNSNGSFDYTADNNAAAQNLTGMEKAGVGLQGMFMSGEIGSARVTTTRNYITARWNTAGRISPDSGPANCGGFPTNKSCVYSMFNNFKGLQLQNIQVLPGIGRAAGPGTIPVDDWHADYEDWFVNNQINPTSPANGQWSMFFSNYVGTNDVNGNTAVAELILSGVALVLPDADKFKTVGLSPQFFAAVEGGTHTVTAHAESSSAPGTPGTPIAGATVNFLILPGSLNAGLSGSAVTDALGNASFTYTDPGPIPSFGTDRIRANIGTLESNVVEMLWTPFNRPPVAEPNSYNVNEDGVLSGNVVTDPLADHDPDNDELTAFLNAGPAHGVVVLNASGVFQYTPAANYCNADSFSYHVNDGMYDSNVAVVSINVVCVNDAPVAGDDSNTTNEDTPVGGSVTANDSDIDNPVLTWSLLTGPAHGAVVFNANGTYTYTPDANYCVGGDSFTYQVSDGSLTDPAAVNITIVCVNDAPSAGDDNASTDEDTPLNASVTGNDADVDSASLTWSLLAGPSNGSLVFNADGAYAYTPNANFCTSTGDSFTYQVSDGSLTDGATVTIVVNCVNDAPTAGDDSASTNEDTPVSGSVAGNDGDVDSASLTWSLGSGPSNGSASVNGDGSYTYTPNANFCGSDSFTYSVTDGTLNASATVAVTVNCVNDAPVANDSAETTAEDTPLVAAVSSSDIDGGAPSYALAAGPSHGTIVFNPNGTYTYSPALNYNGPDSFTFTVSDGAGGSDGGAVSINVTAVNDPPFCAAAGPSVALLWPPDHQLVNVDVLGVTDPVEGSAITINIDSIWQDEPTNTVGDGNTLIDGYGVGTSIAQVRAERSGNKKVPGDGRMYYINFTGTDAQGGTCTGTVKVGVPHDQGNGNTILEGGPLYRSTGS